MLGLAGGAGGTGFDKPQLSPVYSGFNADQRETSIGENQKAMQSQYALMDALARQQGAENQSKVFNQLQGIANGTGPNPAQAMLNQATGANVANQAALMAGQRGAGANVGLMARQAALQGAGIQQQAVGQGATMQANQSLGALGQMGGISSNQVANLLAATNAYQAARQGDVNAQQQALANENQARVASYGNVNQANAGMAQSTQGMMGGLLGGVANAAGAGIPSLFKGAGGAGVSAPVPGSSPSDYTSLRTPGSNPGDYMANGGQVHGPQSSFGQFLHKSNGGLIPESQGSMVDVVLSPGEKVVPPNKVGQAAQGRLEAKTVPGKAKVAGDSLKNDTYETKLPEGSIVVPRTKSKDPRDSAAFVRKTLAKRRKK